MRKFIVTILAILYLWASTGATMHLHYCMGELVEKKLQPNGQDQCSKCGMDENKQDNKDCCRDEHKQLKVTNDQKITETAFQLMQICSAGLPVFLTETPTAAMAFSSVTEENPISNAPPGTTGILLYKRNCVFRI